MQELGIYSRCSYPNTGINCTEPFLGNISSAIEYTRMIGIVTYALLLIPSVSQVRHKWAEYQGGNGKAGPGLRLAGALGNLSAALFTIALFATGQIIMHPTNELVVALSFLALSGANISYIITACSIILIARRVFFTTVLLQTTSTKQLDNTLHNASESLIVFLCIGPVLIVFTVTTILAFSNFDADKIVLVRFDFMALVLTMFDLWILIRIYGWPVVHTLKAYASASNVKGSEAQQRISTNQNQTAKIKLNQLATSLATQLTANEIAFACCFSIFAFVSISNVLSTPEVLYGIHIYSFNFAFPLQHLMNINFLKKTDQTFLAATRPSVFKHSTRYINKTVKISPSNEGNSPPAKRRRGLWESEMPSTFVAARK